jgi:hypothetical protein
MADSKHGSGKLAVITVHGTGDTAPGPDGDKWFQNGSSFAGRLKDGLGARGLDAEIIPHLWSGANSANAREIGARKLAKKVRELSRKGRDVHVIGHSHGGNVANDAACMLGWSLKQRKPKLSSVTTVGTPFFRTHVTTSERLGAWAFSITTLLSILITSLLPIIAAAVISLEADNERARIASQQAGIEFLQKEAVASASPEARAEIQKEIEARQAAMASDTAAGDVAASTMAGVAVLGLPSIIVLIFTIPLALHGLARIRRAGRKQRRDTSLYSIWHPNDEAIAFLMRVEELPIEPFPRWSFIRSSRTSAIVWGIRAVVTPPLTGILLILFGVVANMLDYFPSVIGLGMTELGLFLLIYGLVAGPIIFAVVYIAVRVMAGVMLEMVLRGTLNRSIGGVLKGLAFGRDGDNRIGNVSPRSHYYSAKQAVLEGEVASRMLDASAKATQELFNKYRGSMFAVGVNNTDAVNKLATDAMTWDSLIHTTYFDQAEVADMIAGHIAESVRRPKTKGRAQAPAVASAGQPVPAE